MRDIIFRAWAFEEMHHMKETDYVQLFNDGSGSLWTGWNEKKKENTHCIGVESGCFMQFTGLKDRNGKEIYEGDILRSKSGKNIVEVFWGSKTFILKGFPKGLNELDVHGWLVKNHNLNLIDSLDETLCGEVIGNIYETPHLLNNEQEVQEPRRNEDATSTDVGNKNKTSNSEATNDPFSEIF